MSERITGDFLQECFREVENRRDQSIPFYYVSEVRNPSIILVLGGSYRRRVVTDRNGVVVEKDVAAFMNECDAKEYSRCLIIWRLADARNDEKCQEAKFLKARAVVMELEVELSRFPNA